MAKGSGRCQARLINLPESFMSPCNPHMQHVKLGNKDCLCLHFLGWATILGRPYFFNVNFLWIDVFWLAPYHLFLWKPDMRAGEDFFYQESLEWRHCSLQCDDKLHLLYSYNIFCNFLGDQFKILMIHLIALKLYSTGSLSKVHWHEYIHLNQ